MNRKFVTRLLPALLLLALTGCVKESVENGTHIYSYESWSYIAIFAAGLLGIPAGLLLRKTLTNYWVAILVLPAILAILFGPGLMNERVTINDEKFTEESGFWGMTHQEVVFAELAAVKLQSSTSYRKGVKRTSYSLVCTNKNGQDVKLSLSGQLKDAVAELFIKALEDRNIPMIDETTD